MQVEVKDPQEKGETEDVSRGGRREWKQKKRWKSGPGGTGSR